MTVTYLFTLINESTAQRQQIGQKSNCGGWEVFSFLESHLCCEFLVYPQPMAHILQSLLNFKITSFQKQHFPSTSYVEIQTISFIESYLLSDHLMRAVSEGYTDGLYMDKQQICQYLCQKHKVFSRNEEPMTGLTAVDAQSFNFFLSIWFLISELVIMSFYEDQMTVHIWSGLW